MSDSRAQSPPVRSAIALFLLLSTPACASEPFRKTWREGTLAREASHYRKAEAALRRAHEEASVVDDVEQRELALAGIEMELGLIYTAVERFVEALAPMTSVRDRMRALASDEPARRVLIVTAGMQLSFIYAQLGDVPRTYAEIEQAIKDVRSWENEDERDGMLLTPLLMLAGYHHRDEHHDQARAVMDEAVALALKVYGERSPIYPRFVTIAARQEQSAGHLDEAITLFLRAVELKSLNLGKNAGELRTDVAALIEIYTQLGKTADADHGRARLATLDSTAP